MKINKIKLILYNGDLIFSLPEKKFGHPSIPDIHV